MTNKNISFLKEIGITEWTTREAFSEPPPISKPQVNKNPSAALLTTPKAYWWFFGNPPQGDAQLLFENVIRVLGLASNEWLWKSPSDNLAKMQLPENGVPVVALAFGGPAAQKITGEREPLPQLRETILALNTGNDDEIPVIATLDLVQLVAKSKEKALLWQDLLLAKSVLHNL